jgi:hypothetical protein
MRADVTHMTTRANTPSRRLRSERENVDMTPITLPAKRNSGERTSARAMVAGISKAGSPTADSTNIHAHIIELAPSAPPLSGRGGGLSLFSGAVAVIWMNCWASGGGERN